MSISSKTFDKKKLGRKCSCLLADGPLLWKTLSNPPGFFGTHYSLAQLKVRKILELENLGTSCYKFSATTRLLPQIQIPILSPYHVSWIQDQSLILVLFIKMNSYDFGELWCVYLVSVLGWLLHLWWNSNDVHDFEKGADRNKKESVVNLVGRWERVEWFW